MAIGVLATLSVISVPAQQPGAATAGQGLPPGVLPGTKLSAFTTIQGSALSATGTALPYRDLLLVLATAVIVISLVVQGFTLAPLVRRAGLAVPAADTDEMYSRARLRVAEAGMAYLDQLEGLQAAAPVVVDRVRLSLRNRLELAQEGVDDPGGVRQTYRQVRRDVVAVQSHELDRMYADGEIDDATRRRVQRHLDLEDARFADDR